MAGFPPSHKFDLSRLRVLRSLHIGTWPGHPEDRSHPSTVMEAFLTIKSPVFSELAIVIEGDMATYLPHEVVLFETLGKMSEVRPFKLVFSLDVPDFAREEVWRKLARALDLVTAKGLLRFLGSPPVIRLAESHHYWRDVSFPTLNIPFPLLPH